MAEGDAGGIAGEGDFPVIAFGYKTAVPAPIVGSHAGAPVRDFAGSDLDGSVTGIDLGGLVPGEFGDTGKGHVQEKIANADSRDSVRAPGKAAQSPDIQVIHVGMRQEKEINARKLARGESRANPAPRPNRQGTEAQAATHRKHGIGDDPEAEEVKKDRRMAEPRPGNTIIGPPGRLGMMGRAGQGPCAIEKESAEDTGGTQDSHQDLRGQAESEVIAGIAEADIPDHAANEFKIAGNKAIFNVGPQQIAKDAAEVLMT